MATGGPTHLRGVEDCLLVSLDVEAQGSADAGVVKVGMQAN